MELSTGNTGKELSMDGALSALTQRNVVEATVAQLRKDLGLGPEELPVPEADVFEVLRSAVARRLDVAEQRGELSRLLYQVDVPEHWTTEALALGGVRELAGRTVLRCLQKVVLRLHFSAGSGDPATT
ncbi:MAG: hypothetical protein KDB88_00565 [Flavobacteriales bacterium]|nr:hypothetical protein [Flavobacteriales bacterium]